MVATAADVRRMASECGFELAGVARAGPVPDFPTFEGWLTSGFAGKMGYLTDHRAGLRADPRHLLPSALSVICVGKLYNSPGCTDGGISKYAHGEDYHDLLRAGLGQLAGKLAGAAGPFESRICVDTAPVLERSLAREAGLGWIGRNTCLINQPLGSWFFLGELLVSLDIEPDSPPPDRCGSCTRCIDACPTQALGPHGLDSRLCISYFTIELRGSVPEEHRPGIGTHVFGCDICQDVCPWNRRAPVTADLRFHPRQQLPDLASLADITEERFRAMFRPTPVSRVKYAGFLRNVATALGNSNDASSIEPLRRLAGYADPVVAEAAEWGLRRLAATCPKP